MKVRDTAYFIGKVHTSADDDQKLTCRRCAMRFTTTIILALKEKKEGAVSVADPGCLSRIRIFPSRIQGPKDSGSRIRIKEFKYFLTLKTVSKL